jgi:hypothetical protein
LRNEIALESRRMAEEATWEKINNRVAWKLAEALGSKQPAQDVLPNIRIPIYSWLLLSPELRGWVASLLVEAGLVGCIGIICGVWGGLVVTWILVQISLVMRTRVPWVLDRVRGLRR